MTSHTQRAYYTVRLIKICPSIILTLVEANLPNTTGLIKTRSILDAGENKVILPLLLYDTRLHWLISYG